MDQSALRGMISQVSIIFIIFAFFLSSMVPTSKNATALVKFGLLFKI